MEEKRKGNEKVFQRMLKIMKKGPTSQTLTNNIKDKKGQLLTAPKTIINKNGNNISMN